MRWSRSCEKCDFWDYLSEERGRCRAKTPTITGDETTTGWWPITEADDWCGEFKPDGLEEEA